LTLLTPADVAVQSANHSTDRAAAVLDAGSDYDRFIGGVIRASERVMKLPSIPAKEGLPHGFAAQKEFDRF
jgi:hypothetical protein